MKKLSKTEKAKRGTLDNRHRESAPGAALSTLPPVPEWLSETGAAAFRVISGDLLARGVLYDADIGVLAAFCSQYSDYIEAAEEIKENGVIYTDSNNQKRRNPAILIKNAAYQSMMTGVKTLGLSPYFRSKIEAGEVHREDPREAAINRAIDTHNLNNREADYLRDYVADPIGVLMQTGDQLRRGVLSAYTSVDQDRRKLIENIADDIRGE